MGLALLDYKAEYYSVVTVGYSKEYRLERPGPDPSFYKILISYKGYKSVGKGKLVFSVEKNNCLKNTCVTKHQNKFQMN